MKQKNIFLYTLLIILMVAGCNGPNPPEMDGEAQGQYQGETLFQRKDWGRSLFGPGPINYESINRQKEPYDPITESNVTGKSFRSLDTPRQTEADDQDKIETAIYDMPGVTPGMVILIGGNAWVNVMLEDQYETSSQEQESQILADIEKRLKEVNPRYDYKVIINKFMEA
ncbi:hypothetical protein K8O68_08500 [Salipaludibacillus sp. CUR1]|uniref:hypothetical protein n=1 Tax=Salipaludibacillus sp. CUR1 TaxID=2820003 RepID=UPI001E4A64A9|nr:hypothetical protein [Salipaludibacillus sp. CUR1]MCE7792455.1 hypothetical protein [Salipaludibacillus sp. CUR1]